MSTTPHNQPSTPSPLAENPAQGVASPHLVYEHIIVVDAQSSVAELIKPRLETLLPAKGVHLATTLAQACSHLVRYPQSVVLLEANLPGNDVSKLADIVRNSFPLSAVAIWTHHPSPLLSSRANALGFAAVLCKSMALAEFVLTLELLLRGSRVPPSRDILSRLDSQTAANVSTLTHLSSNQLNILVALAEGLSVKEVAKKFQLTAKGVDSQKYRLMKMLGFNDRVQLTRFAIRIGLISP